MEELLTLVENQPDNIQARMQLVKAYIEKDDSLNAKKELESVLAINPDFIDANFVLAQIYEFDEEFDKAAVCLERVVKQQPHPDLKYKLGQLYESADLYEKALELFNECYQINPEDKDIIERVAHVNRILGNNAEAIDLYNRLLKSDSNNILALTQLMELYEDYDNLLYYVTKAKIHELEGALSHAEAAYKKAVTEAEAPEDIVKLKLSLANIYFNKEKYLQAVDEYLAILEHDSRNFKVYKNLAESYLQLDNLEAACEAYEKAIEINPEEKGILKELADLYVEIEEFEKARVLFENILLVEPKNLSLIVSLAKVYIALDQDNNALEKLNYVLASDPKNVEAIGVLVDFYIINKDYDNAIKYTDQIKQVIPKSPFGYKKSGEVYEATGKTYESHLDFGMYHDLKGEKQLAIDEFSWALEQNPQNLEIILKLARLYEEIAEEYVALEYYQRAYRVDPENSFALEKMGEIYTQKKDFEQAIDVYKEIISIDESNKEVFFNIGNAYEQIKNYDSAIENYNKYISLAPHSNKSDDAKSRVEKIEGRMYGEEDEGLLNKIFRFFSR